jgi:hypothetical protein
VPEFETSVFINCPFDKQYEPILQAILFCITYLRLTPRIARERANSAESRLEKIRELIEGSKYSIHDLSRAQATKKGEIYRLNMPFELGIDYGCRQYLNGRNGKKILILEEKPYRYQASLSDLSGCDIETHNLDYQIATRKVRNWLANEAVRDAPGSARILGKYVDFQEWNYRRQLEAGFSEDDIQDYPTSELMEAMLVWIEAKEPTSPPHA